MRNRKYFLDPNDLQFKQVRLPWKKKILHILLWFGGTIIISILYANLFENLFGSPKEAMLNQQIGNLRFNYTIADRELDLSLETLNSLKMSDEIRYRPILEMDNIPESIRKPGFGGVERFTDLNGYFYSDIMKEIRLKIEELKNMSNVQNESFISIKERSEEWKYEMDHLPAISPVDVKYRLGDKYGFRQIHPVLGIARMHYGQDFVVPYGTEVYATGDGKVVEAGWTSGGYGNYVKIDHGNGLQSIYGHLSKINVPKDINVKRGDLIGLSGSSGTSSGPHLHYQIDKSGQHVNSINYFNSDMTEEEFNEMIQAFGSKSRFR